MSSKAKRVGVIMGGFSSEREISLRSGRAVCDALKVLGTDVVPLEVIEETEVELRRLISAHAVDVVFVAMHGGFGEDGRLQRILEKSGIPYTGPQEASSRLAMDKISSRRIFQKAGLKVPRGRMVRRGLRPFASAFLHYPLVVKPSAQGSSIGISFVDKASQLKSAIDIALQYGDDILIEEFIKGREITVSVLDGRALPIVEIVPKKQFFDYQAKYEKNFTHYIVPAVLEQDVALKAQKDAVVAYQALGCRHLSRVDMIIGCDKNCYVLEVNTIPGFTEQSLFPKAALAAGLSFEKLCEKLVEMANESKKQ